MKPIPLPKISIIITSLNQRVFLEKALRSVIEQNYPNIEIIAVDGGSNDGSLRILEKYNSHLTWWVSEQDRGQSHAINKGLDHCTGEIITFLASDDYYLPDSLATVGEIYLHQKNCGAIVGSFLFLEEPNILGPPIKPFIRNGSPTDLTLGPPGVYRMHQVATFYSTAALDFVGRQVKEELHYVLDRELLYRVVRYFPVALTEQPLGVFRRHGSSKSVTDILKFAQEFASIYLAARDDDPASNRLRKRMARYRIARGYRKFAVSNPSGYQAMKALVQEMLVYPQTLLQPAYYSAWLSIFRNPYPTASGVT